METMKILVTGGAGFIGSNLIGDLVREGYAVTGTHRGGPLPGLPCKWVQLDLLDVESVRNHLLWNRYDVIVHCAALSRADSCETNRKLAFQLNVTATRILAEESNHHHTKFIYISSDLVFDGSRGWYAEEDPVHPLSYYAETKALAEQDVRLICGNYLIIRAALTYGDHAGAPGGFLFWTIGAMQKGEPLHLYLNQFRTVLYVKDLSRSIVRLLRNGVRNETFHAGGPERLNRVDIGRRIAEIFGFHDPPIIPSRIRRPVELGESDDVALLTGKVRNATGIEFTSLLDGLTLTRQSLKENRRS